MVTSNLIYTTGTHPKGWWTRRLIPDLKVWTKDFYVTQLHPRHGNFQVHLYSFGLSECSYCPVCEECLEDEEHEMMSSEI